MSEHWKSTPKYWCKHCQIYVRDTKLEKQNHEATAKHQGNIKRFLRDLHRGHEKDEKEKERARQEIERVSGVVSGSSSSKPSFASSAAQHGASSTPSAASLKKQREQLAELGVSMPSEFRGDMAMPGEWSVTSTRVIKDEPEVKVDAKATGVRKREVPEEEKEEEDAVQKLFKKQKKWGRDSKTMPAEEDKELNALLSGSIVTKEVSVAAADIKQENSSEIKDEEGSKKEENSGGDVDGALKVEAGVTDVLVKAENGENAEPPAAYVVFKKRKNKKDRQE